MTISIKQYMQQLGENASSAALDMARADTASKNSALNAIAGILINKRAHLQERNALDIKNGQAKGLEPALLDRLELTPERIDGMAKGLQQIATLPDPVGEITDLKKMPSGIQVGKMRVPLGVIGIIYESRPNVTADAAALCLKSGNATILRGGSEALHSNLAIAECIYQGLEQAGLPAHAVQVINSPDRAAVGELITMSDTVSVIIPRGGKGLIERISRESTVPIIKHLDGICHVYIDNDADLEKAFNIAMNSKTHRYGVCNAMETLLVSKSVAGQILPRLADAYNAKGVELRGCQNTREIIPHIKAAIDEDWDTEYLAPILSIRVVDGVDQAIEHIHRHSSDHTDCIVSENYTKIMQFMREVDSSSVMVNASTRFADGFEYGLGAEIGISTDKLHARGPVGLEGLTSQKYIVLGEGHVRS